MKRTIKLAPSGPQEVAVVIDVPDVGHRVYVVAAENGEISIWSPSREGRYPLPAAVAQEAASYYLNLWALGETKAARSRFDSEGVAWRFSGVNFAMTSPGNTHDYYHYPDEFAKLMMVVQNCAAGILEG